MNNTGLSASEYKMLLFDYTARKKSEEAAMPQHPIAIKTIMTSDMADVIAKEYGVEMIYLTPSGEKIGLDNDEKNRCIFSFAERSFTAVPQSGQSFEEECERCCQEEDGFDMETYYQSIGMTLRQAMDSLYGKYGYFKDDFLWLDFENNKRVNYLMSIMRLHMPHTIGGYEVVKSVNYEVRPFGDSESKKEIDKINILEYIFHNQARLIIHPSKYGPRVGVYFFAKGQSKEMVYHVLDNLEKYIKIELQS